MPRRIPLTPRGRTVLVVVVALLLTGTTVGGVLAYRKVFGHDCQVEVDGRTTALGRDEALRLTDAAADAVRRGAGVAVAVQGSSELSGQDARDVAEALSGRAGPALTCTGGGSDDQEDDALSAEGLTARAEAVRADLESRFGDLPLGGFAPGGVTTGHMPGSAHYEGRAIDVFFRPISARNKAHGWAFAQYLVAHAELLAISTVIFDGKIWTAHRGFQGWRDYGVSHENRSAATIAILEHRDHVHVDVAD